MDDVNLEERLVIAIEGILEELKKMNEYALILHNEDDSNQN